MPYIAPEIIQEVKRMDLLTYLKNYEPNELMYVSGNIYSTKTHDSLKISNGKWMWWSRGIGGKSALDYLIKVKGIPFIEAVGMLAGKTANGPPAPRRAKETKEKKLLLPMPGSTHTQAVSYLQSRGIDMELIGFCLRTGRLYESQPHRNVVFVGQDKAGKPRYGAIRGIGTDFIGDASGSDKHYSFSIPAEKASRELHLFESAIDLLSFATLRKMEGEDWRRAHLLSLAGVYQPAKEPGRSRVPAALTRFLKEYPEIQKVELNLDNDRAGRLAAEAIRGVLPAQYETADRPPPEGKDYNDYLCIRLGIARTQRAKKKKERGEER